MAIHKPWERSFYIKDGAVMTAGYSLNLTKGQFGIFDTTKQSPQGVPAVSAFTDVPVDKTFELRLGDRQKLTRSTSNKMYSSFPFTKNDVVSIVKSNAKNTEVKVDEVEVVLPEIFPCENKEITIELDGKALAFIGAPDGIATVIVPIITDCTDPICSPATDKCVPVDRAPLVDSAVDYLKTYEFSSGAKLTDYVEVTAIKDADKKKYGIRLKGKVLKIVSGEEFRDTIAYIEDTVQIRVSGGYITDFNYSTTGGRVIDTPFTVTYLSKYEPRTHVGGNLLDDEARAKTFFTGRLYNYDHLGRILSGNESNIVNLDAQYVFYNITLRRGIFSQSLSQQVTEYITYEVAVESGKEAALESLLTALGGINPNVLVDLNTATETQPED